MATGTVRRFIAARNFGFITPDAGGIELFFHASNFHPGRPAEGQRVQFEERERERKVGQFEAYAIVPL